MRTVKKNAFTLVELLVVIGIIALLIGILLPVLSNARGAANESACLSNLNQVGKGFAIYLAENDGVYPAAYVYNRSHPVTGAGNKPDVGGGTAADPQFGYTHWTHFIYGDGTTPQDAFTCPTFDNDGGLPPTNPAPEDTIPGQTREGGTQADVVDRQVRRTAFSVNEVLVPRNKFNENVTRAPTGPGKYYSGYAKQNQVRDSSNVILGTEFHRDWKQISSETSDTSSGGSSTVVKTHRSIHGLQDLGGGGDPFSLTGGAVGGVVFTGSLSVPAPGYTFQQGSTFNGRPMFWVGRNHGTSNETTTNFLFADGSCRNLALEETVVRTDVVQSDGTVVKSTSNGRLLWANNSVPALRPTAPVIADVP